MTCLPLVEWQLCVVQRMLFRPMIHGMTEIIDTLTGALHVDVSADDVYDFQKTLRRFMHSQEVTHPCCSGE